MNHRLFSKVIFTIIGSFLLNIGVGQNLNQDIWCVDEPLRLIQTNLREIDLLDFNIDRYVTDIENIGANTVLINVGGIVANYPSKLPFQYVNPRLKKDVIAEVISKLHDKNIKVIGRFDFSKLNESIAMKNEDWLYVSQKGDYVNYNGQMHTCPCGDYQQIKGFEILTEAIDSYDLDGIFFNMSGFQTYDYSHNYHGMCQCNACKSRFEDWSGSYSLPAKEDKNDPIFLKYLDFKEYVKTDLYARIRTHIKEKDSNICICTYVDDGVDMRRHESGSEHHQSHEWEYHSADNVKKILGSYKAKQVSNAAVHFISFAFRHVSVSPHLTEKRLIQNMLHGSGLDFYCIGRLDNQEDRASLEKVKKVFQFHKQNEKYFTNTQSKADICIISHSKHNLSDPQKGFIRFLSENHIQFDMMVHKQLDSKDTPKALEDYSLVILPGVNNLSDDVCKRLDNYVENGGKLLCTGLTSTNDEIGNPTNRIRLKSLGVEEKFEVYEQSKGSYFKINPEDKLAFKTIDFSALDLVFLYADFVKCKPTELAKPFLNFINSTMFGPPEKCYYTSVTDYPGIIYNEFGKGKTVYFPWEIGQQYNFRSHHAHSALMLGAIVDLLEISNPIKTNASPLVELSYRESQKGDFASFGLLNHSGQLNTAFHAPLPINDIEIRLKTQKKVAGIHLLKKQDTIDFIQEKGEIIFTIPQLNVFEIAVLDFED